MRMFDDGPSGRLSRHFFDGLFDLGFLSDAGARAFTGMLLGVVAVILGIGLLLLRIFMTKYGALMGVTTPQPYRAAALADHAFLIALPMWTAAFVTILIGPALFPDETDLRVLLPLPLARSRIFLAKAKAVSVFLGISIATSQVALAPLLLLTSMNRWAESVLAVRAVAYVAASLCGAICTGCAIVAIHGLIAMAVPRDRVTSVSGLLRSALIIGLAVALLLIFRLPGQAPAFAAATPWLLAVPPAWFVGVERLLTGDTSGRVIQQSILAIAATACAGGIAAGSYVWLYRRFDRTMIQSAPAPRRRRVWPSRWSLIHVTHPVRAAVRRFVMLTLRRSVLHQGIVTGLSAVGLGLVVNVLAEHATSAADGSGMTRAVIVDLALWTPLVLTFATVLATRLALRIPIEPRANWIFRMTERPETRVDQLSAAMDTVVLAGVILPVCLVAPVHALLLGWRSIGSLGSALVCGWLFAELSLRDWDRIPFTCSYIPGKTFVPQTAVFKLMSFLLFTSFGSSLEGVSTISPLVGLVGNGLLLAMIFLLRHRRRSAWRRTSVTFDDVLPSDVHGLRLLE